MHTSQEFDTTRMRAALEVSGIGIWDYDPLTHQIVTDLKCRELLGFTATEPVTYDNLFANVYDEDITNIKFLIDAARISGSGRLLQLNFRIKNGSALHWLTVKGSGYFNRQRKQVYFTGTIQDISSEMHAVNEYKNSESRFLSLIEQAPVATCLLTGKDLIVEIANDKILYNHWGRDRSVIGMPIREVLPELKNQPFFDILEKVYTTGEIYSSNEAMAVIHINGQAKTFYFDFTYKPVLDAEGKVYGVMNMSVDVTEKVMARQKIEQSQKQVLESFEQAPAGIALLETNDFIFTMANTFYGELVGRKPSELLNKRLLEALPEIKGQGFDDLLRDVVKTGKPFVASEIAVELLRNDKLETIYVDLVYQPRLGADGEINGILVIATDVTQQKLARKKLESSEAKLRSVIATAPAGMGLFVGRDLIIEMPNQTFIDIVGKGWDIVGKPLREAMPELLTEGQPFLQILDDVYTSGKMFQSPGSLVKIVQNGVMTYNYYNITYTPLLDENNEVFAILDIAIDVTDTIKAQQATQEAEAALRSAIELAELGTWSVKVPVPEITFSERMMNWFGLQPEDDMIKSSYNAISENDRERMSRLFNEALKPESGGLFEQEYTVINKITGRKRIIHSQGKTVFDDDGNPLEIRGTAQDITSHKEAHMALENEVRERTEQLHNANTELEEANLSLIHSNEELAQYAYVASHDLQEPLRKISLFSKMLKEQDAEKKHQHLIDKIIGSSKRMSMLIKDLLEFSRLLNTDVKFVSTNLSDIVNAVKDDFELLIAEKNAAVIVENLPKIDAVPLHMNQLFNNLISNALKFMKPEKQPKVILSSQKLDYAQAQEYISNALPFTNYYKICVTDNGIGIEERYLKQIFDVFKRLHGREEYYGSGIGLAICRRIAGNHNGVITVESEVGKGTTFAVILPEKQFVIK